VHRTLDPAAAEILGFWFAPRMERRWFAKDPGFDREVRARLQPHHERAAQGAYRHWLGAPRGCLALCLLLDQVPRNLFRDDPRAFVCDGQALEVTRQALARGFDCFLVPPERLFLYLPLEHSEDLVDQERCVRLVATFGNAMLYDFAVRHRDIVARFGRFPHRNAALGRRSTAQEAAFLAQPGSSF